MREPIIKAAKQKPPRAAAETTREEQTSMKRTLTIEHAASGDFLICPVCRHKKLLKLTESTSAAGLVLYCRTCKQESVVNIRAGAAADRVTLAQAGA